MTEIPRVVIDACVLVNFSLCDTLLRLAEAPALYQPKWSNEIIDETKRALQSKLGWPGRLTEYLQSELRANFPEAWITGFERLIPAMPNDPKDRHVLAAAVHDQAPIILTFNLRHFRVEHLYPFGVRALHPDTFLAEIFTPNQALILAKLEQQAADRRRNLRHLLDILHPLVPRFSLLATAAAHPH